MLYNTKKRWTEEHTKLTAECELSVDYESEDAAEANQSHIRWART